MGSTGVTGVGFIIGFTWSDAQETYKYFQNNTTTALYGDGTIRIRLNLGTNKMYLTNLNKTFQNIWVNIGSLRSSSGTSMDMTLTTSFFQNFGTSATAMGNEVNVYSNLTTSNNYCMIGYISAPNNPSYGLYTFTFYFNGPLTSLNYSSLVVKWYNDTAATP